MRKDAAELLEAMRVVLARHEDALQSGDVALMRAACDGLLQDLTVALAQQVGALREALRAPLEPAPVSPNGATFADGLARVQEGDARCREAWAHAALAKRMAEAEGALMHLRLSLAHGGPDAGGAGVLQARRLALQVATASNGLHALEGVLSAWVDAWTRALSLEEGRPVEPEGPRPRPPREAVRAARACLVAGVPEGAAAPLRRALAGALSIPFPLPSVDVEGALARWKEAGLRLPVDGAACRLADAALARTPADPVVAWRLLDFVEMAVDRCGTVRALGASTPSP